MTAQLRYDWRRQFDGQHLPEGCGSQLVTFVALLILVATALLLPLL